MASHMSNGHSRAILSPEATRCMEWIEKEQHILDTSDYGNNKRAVSDILKEQHHRVKTIRDYQGQVDKVTRRLRNEKERETVNTAYASLKFLAEKRLGCLENISQVSGLEDLFGGLTAELADKATSLVAECTKDHAKAPDKDGERVPHSAQSCILAVRNNWNWIGKLVKCTDVHVKHVAEYHQFFHDLAEFDHWLPAELKKVFELMVPDGLRGNREDASRLLTELKMVLTIFLTWQGKSDSIFDRAKKIVPVHLRSRQIDHNRPVTSLCNYKTNDIEIQEGEELVLVDNKMQNSWLVRSLRSKESYVPSIMCLIPPPDPNAVNMALRLRLKLLGLWTEQVKRIGKTLIYFLLLVFREWTREEEEVLKALPAEQKKELSRMCDVIERALIKYWAEYPDFKTLQKRFTRMRWLLEQEGDPKYRNSEMGRALIVQIGVVEDLIRRYKDLWSYWETYKVMVETCRHSEMVLICSKWEDLKFMDTMELLRRWHVGFGDETDGASGRHLRQVVEQVEEEIIEETADLSELANGSSLEGEVYNVETAMETAEAEHISSAEQEEKKTFVITGVIDPRDGQEISLDTAISRGIINQQEGTYVNHDTRTTLPIPSAMNAGWIKVEFTTTKRSEEKRRDIGLITIKTHSESRPYTVKGVKDIKTDRMLSVDDAISEGLIDFKNNVYKNRLENSTITIADALDSGLLDVEIDDDTPVSEPKVDVKTYAIYAVVDKKSRKSLPFGEAVRKGLIDPETGAYNDTVRRQQIYVGDAIRSGYIKASVVKDPTSIDIDPKNRDVIDKMQRRMGAMNAAEAFKISGAHQNDFRDEEPIGDIAPSGDSIFDRYFSGIFGDPSQWPRELDDPGGAADFFTDESSEDEQKEDTNNDPSLETSSDHVDGTDAPEVTFDFGSSGSIFEGFFTSVLGTVPSSATRNSDEDGEDAVDDIPTINSDSTMNRVTKLDGSGPEQAGSLDHNTQLASTSGKSLFINCPVLDNVERIEETKTELVRYLHVPGDDEQYSSDDSARLTVSKKVTQVVTHYDYEITASRSTEEREDGDYRHTSECDDGTTRYLKSVTDQFGTDDLTDMNEIGISTEVPSDNQFSATDAGIHQVGEISAFGQLSTSNLTQDHFEPNNDQAESNERSNRMKLGVERSEEKITEYTKTINITHFNRTKVKGVEDVDERTVSIRRSTNDSEDISGTISGLPSAEQVTESPCFTRSAVTTVDEQTIFVQDADKGSTSSDMDIAENSEPLRDDNKLTTTDDSAMVLRSRNVSEVTTQSYEISSYQTIITTEISQKTNSITDEDASSVSSMQYKHSDEVEPAKSINSDIDDTNNTEHNKLDASIDVLRLGKPDPSLNDHDKVSTQHTDRIEDDDDQDSSEDDVISQHENESYTIDDISTVLVDSEEDLSKSDDEDLQDRLDVSKIASEDDLCVSYVAVDHNEEFMESISFNRSQIIINMDNSIMNETINVSDQSTMNITDDKSEDDSVVVDVVQDLDDSVDVSEHIETRNADVEGRLDVSSMTSLDDPQIGSDLCVSYVAVDHNEEYMESTDLNRSRIIINMDKSIRKDATYIDINRDEEDSDSVDQKLDKVGTEVSSKGDVSDDDPRLTTPDDDPQLTTPDDDPQLTTPDDDPQLTAPDDVPQLTTPDDDSKSSEVVKLQQSADVISHEYEISTTTTETIHTLTIGETKLSGDLSDGRTDTSDIQTSNYDVSGLMQETTEASNNEDNDEGSKYNIDDTISDKTTTDDGETMITDDNMADLKFGADGNEKGLDVEVAGDKLSESPGEISEHLEDGNAEDGLDTETLDNPTNTEMSTVHSYTSTTTRDIHTTRIVTTLTDEDIYITEHTSRNQDELDMIAPVPQDNNRSDVDTDEKSEKDLVVADVVTGSDDLIATDQSIPEETDEEGGKKDTDDESDSDKASENIATGKADVDVTTDTMGIIDNETQGSKIEYDDDADNVDEQNSSGDISQHSEDDSSEDGSDTEQFDNTTNRDISYKSTTTSDIHTTRIVTTLTDEELYITEHTSRNQDKLEILTPQDNNKHDVDTDEKDLVGANVETDLDAIITTDQSNPGDTNPEVGKNDSESNSDETSEDIEIGNADVEGTADTTGIIDDETAGSEMEYDDGVDNVDEQNSAGEISEYSADGSAEDGSDTETSNNTTNTEMSTVHSYTSTTTRDIHTTRIVTTLTDEDMYITEHTSRNQDELDMIAPVPQDNTKSDVATDEKSEKDLVVADVVMEIDNIIGTDQSIPEDTNEEVGKKDTDDESDSDKASEDIETGNADVEGTADISGTNDSIDSVDEDMQDRLDTSNIDSHADQQDEPALLISDVTVDHNEEFMESTDGNTSQIMISKNNSVLRDTVIDGTQNSERDNNEMPSQVESSDDDDDADNVDEQKSSGEISEHSEDGNAEEELGTEILDNTTNTEMSTGHSYTSTTTRDIHTTRIVTTLTDEDMYITEHTSRNQDELEMLTPQDSNISDVENSDDFEENTDESDNNDSVGDRGILNVPDQPSMDITDEKSEKDLVVADVITDPDDIIATDQSIPEDTNPEVGKNDTDNESDSDKASEDIETGNADVEGTADTTGIIDDETAGSEIEYDDDADDVNEQNSAGQISEHSEDGSAEDGLDTETLDNTTNTEMSTVHSYTSTTTRDIHTTRIVTTLTDEDMYITEHTSRNQDELDMIAPVPQDNNKSDVDTDEKSEKDLVVADVVTDSDDLIATDQSIPKDTNPEVGQNNAGDESDSDETSEDNETGNAYVEGKADTTGIIDDESQGSEIEYDDGADNVNEQNSAGEISQHSKDGSSEDKSDTETSDNTTNREISTVQSYTSTTTRDVHTTRIVTTLTDEDIYITEHTSRNQHELEMLIPQDSNISDDEHNDVFDEITDESDNNDSVGDTRGVSNDQPEIEMTDDNPEKDLVVADDVTDLDDIIGTDQSTPEDTNPEAGKIDTHDESDSDKASEDVEIGNVDVEDTADITGIIDDETQESEIEYDDGADNVDDQSSGTDDSIKSGDEDLQDRLDTSKNDSHSDHQDEPDLLISDVAVDHNQKNMESTDGNKSQIMISKNNSVLKDIVIDETQNSERDNDEIPSQVESSDDDELSEDGNAEDELDTETLDNTTSREMSTVHSYKSTTTSDIRTTRIVTTLTDGDMYITEHTSRNQDEFEMPEAQDTNTVDDEHKDDFEENTDESDNNDSCGISNVPDQPEIDMTDDNPEKDLVVADVVMDIDDIIATDQSIPEETNPEVGRKDIDDKSDSDKASEDIEIGNTDVEDKADMGTIDDDETAEKKMEYDDGADNVDEQNSAGQISEHSEDGSAEDGLDTETLDDTSNTEMSTIHSYKSTTTRDIHTTRIDTTLTDEDMYISEHTSRNQDELKMFTPVARDANIPHVKCNDDFEDNTNESEHNDSVVDTSGMEKDSVVADVVTDPYDTIASDQRIPEDTNPEVGNKDTDDESDSDKASEDVEIGNADVEDTVDITGMIDYETQESEIEYDDGADNFDEQSSGTDDSIKSGDEDLQDRLDTSKIDIHSGHQDEPSLLISDVAMDHNEEYMESTDGNKYQINIRMDESILKDAETSSDLTVSETKQSDDLEDSKANIPTSDNDDSGLTRKASEELDNKDGDDDSKYHISDSTSDKTTPDDCNSKVDVVVADADGKVYDSNVMDDELSESRGDVSEHSELEMLTPVAQVGNESDVEHSDDFDENTDKSANNDDGSGADDTSDHTTTTHTYKTTTRLDSDTTRIDTTITDNAGSDDEDEEGMQETSEHLDPRATDDDIGNEQLYGASDDFNRQESSMATNVTSEDIETDPELSGKLLNTSESDIEEDGTCPESNELSEGSNEEDNIKPGEENIPVDQAKTLVSQEPSRHELLGTSGDTIESDLSGVILEGTTGTMIMGNILRGYLSENQSTVDIESADNVAIDADDSETLNETAGSSNVSTENQDKAAISDTFDDSLIGAESAAASIVVTDTGDDSSVSLVLTDADNKTTAGITATLDDAAANLIGSDASNKPAIGAMLTETTDDSTTEITVSDSSIKTEFDRVDKDTLDNADASPVLVALTKPEAGVVVSETVNDAVSPLVDTDASTKTVDGAVVSGTLTHGISSRVVTQTVTTVGDLHTETVSTVDDLDTETLDDATSKLIVTDTQTRIATVVDRETPSDDTGLFGIAQNSDKTSDEVSDTLNDDTATNLKVTGSTKYIVGEGVTTQTSRDTVRAVDVGITGTSTRTATSVSVTKKWTNSAADQIVPETTDQTAVGGEVVENTASGLIVTETSDKITSGVLVEENFNEANLTGSDTSAKSAIDTMVPGTLEDAALMATADRTDDSVVISETSTHAAVGLIISETSDKSSLKITGSEETDINTTADSRWSRHTTTTISSERYEARHEGADGRYIAVSGESAASKHDGIVEELVFVQPLEDITLNDLGLTAEFVCEVSKEGLKAEWYKGDKKIKRSDKYEMRTNTTAHRLIIDKAIAEDEAKYSVMFGDVKSTAALIIKAPPKFTKGDMEDSLTLKAGSSTAVEVPFSGNPQPKVTWTYNDKSLPDKKRMKSETIYNMTSMNLAKAIRGDMGNYKVTLANDSGECSFTIKITVLDKPSPPQNLTATSVTEESVGLKWESPANNGGSDITGYVLEKRENTKGSWTNMATVKDMEYTADKLTDKAQYVFRVAAKNNVGVGDFVQLSQAVTAKSQHDAPSAPNAPEFTEISKDAIAFTWRAPEQDGGSPITGYFVERRLTSSKRWVNITKNPVTELSYSDPDVMEDNEYEYRIIAINKIGQSEAGSSSKAVIAKDPWVKPGKPCTPEFISISDGKVSLKWTAPEDDGGCPISNYVLEYRKEGTFQWTRVEQKIAETEFTVKKLRKDEIYEFHVCAENKAGLGPFSDNTMPMKAEEPVTGSAPEVISGLQDVVVVAPNEVVLTCEIESGEPESTISWYKNGREIRADKKYSYSYEEDEASLTIKLTEPADSANYMCKASNKLATVDTECSLTVHLPPEITYEDKLKEPQSMKSGSTLILHVNISGSPIPKVSWAFNEATISVGNGTSIETTDTYSTLTIKGVTHTGRYTVTAENVVVSVSADFTVTIRDKPSPPCSLRVTEVYKDYVVLAWDEPETDGGSPITSYTIEKRDMKRSSFVKVDEVTSLTLKVPKLIEGNEYWFRVSASNEIGTSDWTTLDEPVKARLPFDPPGQPRNVQVNNITKSDCDLTWEVPENDGGSPITGYFIERSSGYSSRWTKVNKNAINSLELHLNDLSEGTEYNLRVTAVNDAGVGKPSEATGTFTAKNPYDVPGRPGQPEVTETTKDTATIIWKAPETDGGAPIDNYKIEMKRSGDIRWQIVKSDKVTDLEFTIPGLKEETEYEFRVTAENKAGPGQPSVPSKPAKYAPPKFLKEIDETITLKTGGSTALEIPFSAYPMPKVEWKFNGGKLPDAKRFKPETIIGMTSMTIAKVVRKDSGVYTLILKNEHGQCDCKFTLIVLDKPGPPVDMRVADKNENSVGLTWDIPEDDGGSDITGYVIEQQESGKRAWKACATSKDTTYTAISLTEGTTYVFRVAAENDAGRGPFVELSQAVVPKSQFDPPSAPEHPEVSEIFKDYATLTWKPPATDGGSPITGYVIERRTTGGSRWLKVNRDLTSDLTYKVTELIEDTQYEFHIMAENKVGQGPASSVTNSVKAKDPWQKPGKPDQPGIVSTTNTAVSLKWCAPSDDGGAEISNYVVEYRAEGAFKWLRANKEIVPRTSYQVKGLDKATVYEFRVSAENKAGGGPASDPTKPVEIKEPINISKRQQSMDDFSQDRSVATVISDSRMTDADHGTSRSGSMRTETKTMRITEVFGSHTEMSGSRSGMSGSRSGMSGSHTGISGSHTEKSGSRSEKSGSHSKMSGSHSDVRKVEISKSGTQANEKTDIGAASAAPSDDVNFGSIKYKSHDQTDSTPVSARHRAISHKTDIVPKFDVNLAMAPEASVRRFQCKLRLDAEIDFELPSSVAIWRRIWCDCLPVWLLLLLLLITASLMYLYVEEGGCVFQNNHRNSMDMVLNYHKGAPPV